MAIASAGPSRVRSLRFGPPPRWLTPVAAVVVLAAALETVLAAVHAHYGGGDFVTALWSPAKALLDGVDPYRGGAALARATGDAIAAPVYAPLGLLVHL